MRLPFAHGCGLQVWIAMGGAVWSALAAETVPDKTVVLTFDDAVTSHLEVVAPLLKQQGFGATFFVSHAWMTNREHFLTWSQVAQLHQMGFEIGNHSWTHIGFNTPRAASQLAGELALVENELARLGVPKPVTFAWTGNAFGPEAMAVLARAGYQLARRGMQPEVPYGSLELGPLFDPVRHHRLLIPSAGDANPDWTLNHFKKVVDRAKDGRIVVLQFHGVPDVTHPWVHTPPERFRAYVDYLKEGGFRVIAMRDLLPLLPEKLAKDDPMVSTRYPAGSDAGTYWPVEVQQTLERLDDWLPNLVYDHHYRWEETMLVTAMPRRTLESRLVRLRKGSNDSGRDGRVKVLPYPGGRHPRIGFLEGAIDPLRGTKVSIFPPWPDGGYVVLDLPEAIFSNLGLVFLAHTHVPTLWNARNAAIENVDWLVTEDGGVRSEWRLPNGIAFGARVAPQASGADFELWLHNGTDAELSTLRTQVCLMLKGAPGFEAQDQERKTYESPFARVRALNADRHVLLAFERCGRAWGNEQCPCIHSDPVLPDAAPGQRVAVRGLLRFYEGSAVEAEQQKLQDTLRALQE